MHDTQKALSLISVILVREGHTAEITSAHNARSYGEWSYARFTHSRGEPLSIDWCEHDTIDGANRIVIQLRRLNYKGHKDYRCRVTLADHKFKGSTSRVVEYLMTHAFDKFTIDSTFS